MRAVHYTPPGLISNLEIVRKSLPQLRDKECLIKVCYSAINRADTLQRKGLYPPPLNESDILGLEAAGFVYDANNSTRWKKNDRVKTKFILMKKLSLIKVIRLYKIK
jgi:tumor protein p53-inducible protein 3